MLFPSGSPSFQRRGPLFQKGSSRTASRTRDQPPTETHRARTLLKIAKMDSSSRREIYASREKCLTDWGSEDSCDQKWEGSYHGPHYFCRGGVPYYYRRGGDQAQPLGAAAKFSRLAPGTASLNSSGSLTTSPITRGGFGRIGSFFRAGS